MNESVYQARMALLRDLNVPVTRADSLRLRARQAWKLFLWEAGLRSLFAIKRAVDVVCAAGALVLFSPMYLLVGLAVWIEDGWPVFYTQTRVGLNGHVFRFYKFRSMYRDADRRKAELMARNESADGVIFKMKNDPRVTKVGRILRRYSIDETPQFYNVLIGDLSIVGPRPPVPVEVAQYTLADRKRLHVKPGLTCLWQIKGRSDIPFKDQVRLDLEYIHSQSFWKDVLIMIKTVPAVLLGRGAY